MEHCFWSLHGAQQHRTAGDTLGIGCHTGLSLCLVYTGFTPFFLFCLKLYYFKLCQILWPYSTFVKKGVT